MTSAVVSSPNAKVSQYTPSGSCVERASSPLEGMSVVPPVKVTRPLAARLR